MVQKILKRWDLFILAILVLSYTIIFSRLSILRHNAFASSYDLANMGQTVWNTFSGRPFTLSGGDDTISRFSIHADLILALLSPLYLIWDNVRTLLIAQSSALGFGGIPIYFLAKKVLGNLKLKNTVLLKFISLSVVLIYLLNPSMEWTNIYDFHGVALSIPFLLASFYFAYSATREKDKTTQKQKNRMWIFFWVFTILALTTKEEVGLLVAMMGIWIFFILKQRKEGVLTFITGVSWFLITVLTIIPYFSANGQDWGVNSLYSVAIQKIDNSNTPLQLLDVFRGYFLDSSAAHYYSSLLKPFSYIPILGLPWILLATPEFVINLMSTNPAMQALTYHYDSGITPFLNIAMIFGLYYLFLLFKSVSFLRRYLNIFIVIVTVWTLTVALRINYHYSPLPTTPSCWCVIYNVTKEDKAFAKVLGTIPPNASVASSSEVRAHLTRRENSYNLPAGVYTADYVAMIDQNRAVGDYSAKPFENSLLNDSHFLTTHKLLSHIGHFYLFKRIK